MWWWDLALGIFVHFDILEQYDQGFGIYCICVFSLRQEYIVYYLLFLPEVLVLQNDCCSRLLLGWTCHLCCSSRYQWCYYFVLLILACIDQNYPCLGFQLLLWSLCYFQVFWIVFYEVVHLFIFKLFSYFSFVGSRFNFEFCHGPCIPTKGISNEFDKFFRDCLHHVWWDWVLYCQYGDKKPLQCAAWVFSWRFYVWINCCPSLLGVIYSISWGCVLEFLVESCVWEFLMLGTDLIYAIGITWAYIK